MLIALWVLLAGGGLILLAGAWKKRRLKAAYPPPGRMVDVGGYQLHVQCLGTGEPTVVIDAGQGDFSVTWANILSHVAPFARVCAYDRAGLGWSDPSPRPRTVEDMVEELRALLAAAGIPGPYVMVSASTSGMNARLFAHRYPSEVAGLVLVDAAHEEQFSAPVVREALDRMRKMVPLMNSALMMVVRSGLAALWPALLPDGGVRAKLPVEDVSAYNAVLVASTKHLAAAAAELRDLEETHVQMRSAQITTLGDIPLVVLRHGAGQPMMASPEVVAALEETFARLQAEMATLSTNGRLVVAEQSGHAIHLDQPELVVEAIRRVVTAARERPVQTVSRSQMSPA